MKTKAKVKNPPKTIELTIGEWRDVLRLYEENGEDEGVISKKIKAVLDTIDSRYLKDLS